MSSRDSLRQHYRQLRKNLPLAAQRQAAQQLADKCQALSAFQSAQKLALYLANDGELDPTEVIHLCWKLGKEVYLPVLHPFCSGHLLFVRYTANSVMKANLYGIAEPVIKVQDICPVTELDIVFAPLVAFDSDGNRLGMGGGFYDRTLVPVYRSPERTNVIGLAHQCQKASALPGESWDLPMQHILVV